MRRWRNATRLRAENGVDRIVRAQGTSPAYANQLGLSSKAPAARKDRPELPSTNGLAANAQTCQICLVTLWIRITQVSQKPATLGDQCQQAFAGAVVVLVRLEMLRQHRDTRAQQGNLYFWRPGVGFVALICGKNLPLCFNRQCHS